MPALDTLPRLILEYARLEVGSGERHAQYEQLADKFTDLKVIREIEQQVQDGLVEYGTSLRSCWLTPRGRYVLADQLVKEQV